MESGKNSTGTLTCGTKRYGLKRQTASHYTFAGRLDRARGWNLHSKTEIAGRGSRHLDYCWRGGKDPGQPRPPNNPLLAGRIPGLLPAHAQEIQGKPQIRPGSEAGHSRYGILGQSPTPGQPQGTGQTCDDEINGSREGAR